MTLIKLKEKEGDPQSVVNQLRELMTHFNRLVEDDGLVKRFWGHVRRINTKTSTNEAVALSNYCINMAWFVMGLDHELVVVWTGARIHGTNTTHTHGFGDTWKHGKATSTMTPAAPNVSGSHRHRHRYRYTALRSKWCRAASLLGLSLVENA